MKIINKLNLIIIISVTIIEIITTIILIEHVYDKDAVIALSLISYVFITTSIIGLIEKRNYFAGSRFAKKSVQLDGSYYGNDNDVNQIFGILVNIIMMFLGLLCYYLNFVQAFEI